MKMNMLDGLMNFVTNLGVLGKDKGAANSYYTPTPNVSEFLNLYRSSWSGRRVVEVPVGDMTREWRTWQDGDGQELTAMAQHEIDMRVKEAVKKALTMAQVTGTAAIYLGMDVGDAAALEEPLNHASVRKGDIKYLTVFDRTELTVAEYDRDAMSHRFMQGKLYSVNRGDVADRRVHYTRFIWFSGKDIPAGHREVMEGFDDSCYVGLEALIKSADSAIAEILSLIPEAKVDVMKLDGLAERMDTAESEAALSKWATLMAYMKSSQNMVLVDKDDDYTNKSVQFSGIGDVARQAIETLAGAADIPITRFMGVSPGGLNSTGESDLRNYYDGVASKQENELRSALRPLDLVLLANAGQAEDTVYEWNSLWQPTKQETAELGAKVAATLKDLSTASVFDPLLLAEVGRAMLEGCEAFPGAAGVFEEFGDDYGMAVEEPEDPEDPDGGEPGNGDV